MNNTYKYCLRAASLGDLCGSAFEGRTCLVGADELIDKNLLYSQGYFKNRLTDDSVCTMAIATAIMNGKFNWEEQLKTYGNQYLSVGYGPKFYLWLIDKGDPDYASWGNGSAMRCSSIAWYAKSLDECDKLIEDSCKCTHNTEYAIKGAQCLGRAIWLAKNGHSKEEIVNVLYDFFPEWKETDFDNYESYFNNKGEKVDFYWFLRCDHIVGMCLKAFEVSESWEHAIKLAISQGRDTDTAGCIISGLAYAYYKEIPEKYLDVINQAFDANMKALDDIFCANFVNID